MMQPIPLRALTLLHLILFVDDAHAQTSSASQPPSTQQSRDALGESRQEQGADAQETSPAPIEEILEGASLDRQRAAGFDARLGIGFVLPALSGAFMDAYTPGYHLLAEAGWQWGQESRYHLALALGHARFFLGDPHLADSVAAEVNAERPTSAEPADPANVDSEGGALPMTELLAQLRWDITTGDLRPYLLGGAGAALFLPRVTRYAITAGATAAALDPNSGFPLSGERQQDDDIAPLVSVGIGLTDPTGPLGLFAQCRFSWAIASDAEARWATFSVGAEL